MKKFFKVSNKNGRGEVFLYQDIGGFWGLSSKEFIDNINKLGNVKEVDFRVSSEGGSVVPAIDMYNAIRRHPANWTAYIDGLAASAASWVVLAANKVVMADNAQYMIHRAAGVVGGTADQVRKAADLWEDIENTAIISAYRNKTGLSKKEILNMMDSETWMNAQKAYDLGFVDEIGGDMELAASVTLSGHYQYMNAPKRLTNKTNPLKEKLNSLKKTTEGLIK